MAAEQTRIGAARQRVRAARWVLAVAALAGFGWAFAFVRGGDAEPGTTTGTMATTGVAGVVGNTSDALSDEELAELESEFFGTASLDQASASSSSVSSPGASGSGAATHAS